MEDVLPVGVPLRQWVLTVPFAWRKRLGYDGPLLSALTRLFVKTVLEFYGERGGGDAPGQSGAVVAVQRTSSDLKLNPHVHAVFLDGVFRDDAEEGGASERAGLTRLAASAVSGLMPPAGPEWRRGALPVTHRAMVFERPLCVALDGFTLHAAGSAAPEAWTRRAARRCSRTSSVRRSRRSA